MSVPAEITSTHDWDRLIVTLRAQHRDVDALYDRLTSSDPDYQQFRETEPMTEPTFYPDPGYDTDDRAAERDEQQRVRLDEETDGRLDGDYTRDDDADMDL